MFSANVDRVLSKLSPTDVVLDIGGWACPFNRANYVMDGQPYETRGFYARAAMGEKSQGGDVEHFRKDTWIVRDICAREPYPFKDKELDFVICSHTLEDIRDPLWVCSEMIRIAKRGYIETPSRIAEACRGWEDPHIAGLSHHRWIVEIKDGAVEFMMKPHLIHARRRYSLPRSYVDKLPSEARFAWLFWDDSYEYRECLSYTRDDLEAWVQSIHPRPAWELALEKKLERAEGLARRTIAGIARRASRLTSSAG